MTIPEAAWLILDAAALGADGDLFVLDMGDPVKIMDLARDLVRLSGRDPDSQPIETVGLRPGEKLHEELFYDIEHVEPTESAKVLRATSPLPPPTVRDDMRRLMSMATGDDEPALGEALLEYVRHLTANGGAGLDTAASTVDSNPAETTRGRPAGATGSASG
jgi:FlaA1/EpsC-like NDP-sugar epimerase